MAEREDNTLRNVAVGAGAAVAGVVATDQVVRARARQRLGADFSPEGLSRVSAADRAAMRDTASRVPPQNLKAVSEFASGKSWLANRFLRSGEMVDVKQGQVIPVPAGEQAKRLPAYNDMIGEGAASGAATAALPLAGAGAAKVAMMTGLVGKSAMALAAKAALPLSIVGTAGFYGWRAMQEGKGVSSVGKAAAWGALNGIIPVDLAMQAYGAVKTSSGSTANTRPANLTPEQTKSYQSLNEKFASAGPQPEQADGEGKRGWANPATQRAAQEARGVVQFTDWTKA